MLGSLLLMLLWCYPLRWAQIKSFTEVTSMTKEQILARIARVLDSCTDPSTYDKPDGLVSGALTLTTIAYGENSQQLKAFLKRLDDIAKGPSVDRNPDRVSAVEGLLTNLREEIEDGLLSSLERRITSDVLSDLIQLARRALEEPGDGAKNVAAVLVAAAFEDTIRRIAKEHAGVIGEDKLENVIGKLKDAGLLIPPQLGIALSHLSFRNHALHAKWDAIERVAVESVLAFVEQMLLKHFN